MNFLLLKINFPIFFHCDCQIFTHFKIIFKLSDDLEETTKFLKW